MPVKTKKNPASNILYQGYQVLIKNLGPQKAGEFLHVVSKGQGDSVKEYAKLWEGKGLDEINETLLAFQASRKL